MRLPNVINEIEACIVNKPAKIASLVARRTTTKSLLAAFLSLAAAAAFSQNYQGQNGNGQGQNYGGGTVSAPEIDPAQAMGAIALLGGTIAIVRGCRSSKK